MIDKFLEETKKELNETFKIILSKAGERYDEFWQKILKDLTENKFILEEEIKVLSKTKLTDTDEIQKVSIDLITLKETLKKKQELSVKYETRQKELLDSILEMENQDENNKRIKKELEKKEKRLVLTEMEQNLRSKVLQRREEDTKKLYEQAEK